MAEKVPVAGTSRLVSWKVAGDGVCGEGVRPGHLFLTDATFRFHLSLEMFASFASMRRAHPAHGGNIIECCFEQFLNLFGFHAPG